MAKISAKDWQNRKLEEWNTTTFHAYLIDKNKELFKAEYVPSGKGALNNRWNFEKGSLKNALTTHGEQAIKAFIDQCFQEHRFNPDFPAMTWGFIWSYKRNILSKVMYRLNQTPVKAEKVEKETNWDDLIAQL